MCDEEYNYVASHYAVFSILLLLQVSSPPNVLEVFCSHAPLCYVVPLTTSTLIQDKGKRKKGKTIPVTGRGGP
jgi:hypothetical protein